MATVLVGLEKLKDPHVGLGQFALNFGRALLHEANGDLEPVLMLPDDRRGIFADFTGARYVPLDPLRKEPYHNLLRILGVRQQRYDAWHLTHQEAAYLPYYRDTPVVLTIHDLNFLRERKKWYYGDRLKKLQARIDRAAVVTAVSEFTASEVRKHIELRGKPVHVIHNGLPSVEHSDPRPPAGMPEGRFLLAIGRVTDKKNFHVLIDFIRGLPDYSLVIAGRKDGWYGHQIMGDAVRAGVEKRLFMPGEVGGGERYWLYLNCEALLFPSLTEGFGLPVLEAMSQGKPVFMSRATSLPEVGGELGFYWESYRPDAMLQVFTEGISRVRSDPAFSNKLKSHATGFSWRSAARSYLDLYRSLF